MKSIELAPSISIRDYKFQHMHTQADRGQYERSADYRVDCMKYYHRGLPHILEMCSNLQDKKPVYVEVCSTRSNSHHEGAIAQVVKIDDMDQYINASEDELKRMSFGYTIVHLKWDDRPSRASIKSWDLVWLPEYNGPTRWTKLSKESIQQQIKPIYDRRGKEIKIGMKVYFINASYGSSARLEQGVVQDIQATIKNHKSGVLVYSVLIENEDNRISTINAYQNFILVE